MAAFLTAVCVVASVTSLHADIGTLTTMLSSDTDVTFSKVKNKTFVDVIKESLRKNNDDYAIDTQLDGELQTPVKTRRQMNESDQIAKSEDALAKSEENPETEIPPATPPVVSLVSNVFRSAMKDFVRKKKHDHHSKHTTHEVTSTTKTTQTATDRKVKEDKRKLVFGKINKQSSKVETSQPARVSRNHNAMRPHSNVARQATTNPEATTPTRFIPHHPLDFGILVRTPGLVRKPPSADQLDMAPARGAYIHDMRIKGKFCHRHVLWPEGPKYNSKGETIMPAFNASIYHGKRRFFETHKPMFVLPRCCNCCKKSVLGCQ